MSARTIAVAASIRMLLCAGLIAGAEAQSPEALNWNLSGPPAAPEVIQRRQQPPQQPQQPMPPPMAGDAAQLQRQPSAVPDGYRTLRAAPPAAAPPSGDQRAQSQLPESSRPLEQQVDMLRRRVAELIRQMDDMQVRMVVSEQMLANHRHSYSYPNMGFISVESYNSYLERQQRNGQPVPFFSGSMMTNTTSLSVVPK